jgi:predicted dehydrogenase
MRIGVVGIEHLHLFELVDGLVNAGAETVAHASGDGGLYDMYAGWRDGSEERPVADVLSDDSLDLIVTADVPSRRAEIAVAALEAGRHVLSDKPGVTTAAELDAVCAAAAASGGHWCVLFGERSHSPAVTEAVRMARAGELGRVVHVVGLGPHTAAVDQRPDWFLRSADTGGILVDLGSHQVDQFLSVTGADPEATRVVAASAGLVRFADDARSAAGAFEDVGHLVLVGGGAVGHHRVDYLEPAGLGTWGDTRLTVVGTEATVEVRANIDVTGAEGTDHLIVVDAEGTRRVDCSDVDLDWAERLLADLADGGDRFEPRGYSAAVTRLTLDAAALAAASGDWGSPA